MYLVFINDYFTFEFQRKYIYTHKIVKRIMTWIECIAILLLKAYWDVSARPLSPYYEEYYW